MKEYGIKLNILHPITFQSGTLQGSQKNWSTIMKEDYAICMPFHRMVFYLKDGHVIIVCDHAPLWKFIYSVMKTISYKRYML